MNFTEHNNGEDYSIGSYEAGVIEVAGESFSQAILVKPNGVLTVDFDQAQALTEAFVAELLQQKPLPELIVVGTGDKQQFLPPKIQVQIAQARIGLEMMSTASACRTFNILLSEDRKVWALLWPTTA